MLILHAVHIAIAIRSDIANNTTLQKLEYDIHTKLPLESYQIQI